MNHTQAEAADLVATARGLGPLIHDRRDESERERRLPASVLSAMQKARLFRMYVPVEYSGLETDPITSMQTVEAVAEADAAAAWNLMIGATYGIWAAFLPEAGAREIYGRIDAVVAGGLRPSGIADATAGVTGSVGAGRLPAGSITVPGGMVAALSTKMGHLA